MIFITPYFCGFRRKERDTHMISESPFISTIGEKYMNGLGTYYGTFITEMESV